MSGLPSFPVDDQALDMIEAAIAGTGGEDGRSSVGDLCRLFSELGGSETSAIESTEGGIDIMRDPQYHSDDIITALIAEVRRLRGSFPNRPR